MTTGVGITGSAVDIIAKPIQVYHRSGTATPESKATSPRRLSTASDDAIYGLYATLGVPASHMQPSDAQQRQRLGTFGAAVVGSASGFGGFFKHGAKGMSLDLPLAVAEGMRVAPRLYGGEVYDLGTVRDWKTGGIVAGKNFAHGIVEGFGGIVTTPVKGAKKEGAIGAAKGVGRGLLDMGTKATSGMYMSKPGIFPNDSLTM